MPTAAQAGSWELGRVTALSSRLPFVSLTLFRHESLTAALPRHSAAQTCEVHLLMQVEYMRLVCTRHSAPCLLLSIWLTYQTLVYMKWPSKVFSASRAGR